MKWFLAHTSALERVVGVEMLAVLAVWSIPAWDRSITGAGEGIVTAICVGIIGLSIAFNTWYFGRRRRAIAKNNDSTE